MIDAKESLPPGWIDQVRIRLLVKDDLPALEWEGQYRHFRRLYSEIYRSMEMGKALMWVAESPELGLIGQVFVQLLSGRPELANGRTRAYIYGFRIKEEYRGQGLGTRMLQVVEGDLLSRGIETVTLNVGKDNPDARRLYERCHYRVVADEEGRWSYIDDSGQRRMVVEPAWRMEKRLV